jgi:hypothetical protein
VDYWFYVAKCVLGFSSRESWRLTVRQIHALLRQHAAMRAGHEPDDENDEGGDD